MTPAHPFATAELVERRDLHALQAEWDRDARRAYVIDLRRHDAALAARIERARDWGWWLHAVLVTGIAFLLPVVAASAILQLRP